MHPLVLVQSRGVLIVQGQSSCNDQCVTGAAFDDRQHERSPLGSSQNPMCRSCRDKALATISADGILLVLASMIDNMPYVLAEASVMRIPLLIYDVGGVTEMIDPKLHADIICGTPKVRRATKTFPKYFNQRFRSTNNC